MNTHTPARVGLERLIARSQILLDKLAHRFLVEKPTAAHLSALSLCEGNDIAEQLNDRASYGALVMLSLLGLIDFEPYHPDGYFDPDDTIFVTLTALGRAQLQARLAGQGALEGPAQQVVGAFRVTLRHVLPEIVYVRSDVGSGWWVTFDRTPMFRLGDLSEKASPDDVRAFAVGMFSRAIVRHGGHNEGGQS